MFDAEFFAHVTPSGVAPHDRMIKEGADGDTMGENLYGGGIAIRRSINAWTMSDGHFKNIKSYKYRKMGFGYYKKNYTVNFTSQY